LPYKPDKLNCWEFLKCGREPGGRLESELGPCPAPLEERLDGVHDGISAGRACWAVSGTLCCGKVSGTFAKKFASCELCEFYHYVKNEEMPHFKLCVTLLSMLEDEECEER
jgi:hypothetical protein